MSDKSLKERVIEVLEEIRPKLQFDGGDLEFVDLDEEAKIVKVRLKGACVGCAGSYMTLQFGIAKALKERIPEIVSVEGVE